MPKHSSRLLPLILIGGVAAACAREVADKPPVATPTVTMSRSDIAVGTPVEITYRFEVAQDAPAFTEDYLVFVHFLDPDRERMWDDDHHPATPTRQWTPGATIQYTRTMFVPKFPYVGPTDVEIGLYSASTGERLPLAGSDSGMRAYKVASFNMSLDTDNVFVVFGDGWHEAEVADDGGQEWRWLRRSGTVSFRNPTTDVVLFVDVDQPVMAFDQPQQVEVRLGDGVLDTFSLPAGARELRRIQIPAAQLGTAENVQVSVAVDRTFVPAGVAALRSADPRELGVRVFRVYVQNAP